MAFTFPAPGPPHQLSAGSASSGPHLQINVRFRREYIFRGSLRHFYHFQIVPFGFHLHPHGEQTVVDRIGFPVIGFFGTSHSHSDSGAAPIHDGYPHCFVYGIERIFPAELPLFRDASSFGFQIEAVENKLAVSFEYSYAAVSESVEGSQIFKQCFNIL